MTLPTRPTDDLSTAPTPRLRIAAFANDVLAPWNFAILMPPVVGALTMDSVWRGITTGLIVSVIGGALPALLVRRGLRSGQFEDKFVGNRRDRPGILAQSSALILLSWVLTLFAGASRTSLAFVGLMVVMTTAAAIISKWWKISIHAMVAAGSVVLLAILRLELIPLLLVIPINWWARRTVSAHTAAQLAGGTLLGVALGFLSTLP